MDKENSSVLLIMAGFLGYTLLVSLFGYFGLPIITVLAPLPVIIIFVFGFYTLYGMGRAKRGLGGQARALLDGIQTAAVHLLVYVAARAVLGVLAPAAGAGTLYAFLVGIQTGAIVSIFYVLYATSRLLKNAAKRGGELSLPFSPYMMQQLALYSTLIGAAGVLLVYASLLSLGGSVTAFIYVTTATVLLSAGLFAVLGREILYVRNMLSGTNRRALEKVYLVSFLLMIFVLASSLQELFFARSIDSTLAAAASGIGFVTLLLTFFVLYFIVHKFRYEVGVSRREEEYERKSLE